MRAYHSWTLIYKSMCALLKVRTALRFSSRPKTKGKGPLWSGHSLILVLMALQFLIKDNSSHMLFAFWTYLGIAAINIENGTTFPA